MALVIQTKSLEGSYVPYERPPDPIALWSAIPRGLQSFTTSSVLDAIAVNDDALLQLTATLPPNFAYVMQSCSLTLSQAGGSAWAAKCNLNLQNFYRAPVDIAIALTGNWIQNMESGAQDNSTRVLSLEQPWPSFPLIGVNGTSGILIVLSTFNNAQVARAVGTIECFMSFWQFDLEQVRKFAINSPLPTHSR